MKKRKISYRKIFLFITTLFFCVAFIISSIHIIKWLIDSKSTQNNIEKIKEDTKIEEKSDTENTIIIDSDAESDDPYWDYIKVNLIDVDFNDLKKVNSSIVGWIQVNGTNINYPFVQAKNNTYYLTRSIDKTRNNAGWVFLDYHNNLKSSSDKNTIIYAHGRLDDTMFGSLRKVFTSGWFDNKDNYIIKLSTENENSLWQVFSLYKIPTTSDYLKINFKNDSEFLKFAQMLLKRSDYDFETNISSNDRILTLSTCYDNDTKIVLHAKLIKLEKK